MTSCPVLWFVVPCYNEQEVLPVTAPIFLAKLTALITSGRIAQSSRILFVDDGSQDSTWKLIKKFSRQDNHYAGISLSRNRGHQNAILAGLMEAKDRCDVTLSLDCDGQDDINALDEMLSEYAKGSDVVYGVRADRMSDTWFKRSTAQSFYRLMSAMGAEVVYNHADYRLVSSRVLEHLADFQEVNIFLRGMFPLVGFRSSCVMYERNRRAAGETHYPLSKMLAFAFDGITSLTVRPITIIALAGVIVGLGGFFGIVWAVVAALSGHNVTGWASTMCVMCFMGGLQLFSIGVIGEYVGKTYLESKHRPRYIISERTTQEGE